MTIQYYLDTKPTTPLLLRRTRDIGVSCLDEAFFDEWLPTDIIGAYMVGRNDWVDDISEAQARRVAPAAF